MKILRTPEKCFLNLIDYPFASNYIDIDHDDQTLRMHYLDENSASEEVVLLMHGEPTWSYLYRKIIPILAFNGKRVIAPDLIGFGKSDKPASREDYSYANHIMWVETLIKKLDLKNIIFFAQDWGGLIGLRLLAKYPDLYEGLVVSNSGLPVGSGATDGFMQWLDFSQNVEDFDCGKIVNQGSLKQLSEAEAKAFYVVHQERPFYNDLVAFMTSGPVVLQVLEGENAVRANREVMGATNPADAADGTIRRDFAESIEANSVHGSDSPENAEIEISYFFAGCEITE